MNDSSLSSPQLIANDDIQDEDYHHLNKKQDQQQFLTSGYLVYYPVAYISGSFAYQMMTTNNHNFTDSSSSSSSLLLDHSSFLQKGNPGTTNESITQNFVDDCEGIHSSPVDISSSKSVSSGDDYSSQSLASTVSIKRWRVGDWICPNCHSVVYAFKFSCFNCGTKKEACAQQVPRNSESPLVHSSYKIDRCSSNCSTSSSGGSSSGSVGFDFASSDRLLPSSSSFSKRNSNNSLNKPEIWICHACNGMKNSLRQEACVRCLTPRSTNE